MDRLPQPARYVAPHAHGRVRIVADKAAEIVTVTAIIVAAVVLVFRLGATVLGEDPYPTSRSELANGADVRCTDIYEPSSADGQRCYTYSPQGDRWFYQEPPPEPDFLTLLGHNLLAGLDWWLWLGGITVLAWLLVWLVSGLTQILERRSRRAHARQRAGLTEIARHRPYEIMSIVHKEPEPMRKRWLKGARPEATIEVTGRPLDDASGKPKVWVLKPGQVMWAQVSSPGTLACFPQATYSDTDGSLQRGSKLRVMSPNNDYGLPEDPLDELTAGDTASLLAHARLLNQY
jgi:hypothetical protein